MTASITSFRAHKAAKAQNPEETKKILAKMRENDAKHGIVLNHKLAKERTPL